MLRSYFEVYKETLDVISPDTSVAFAAKQSMI